MKIVAIKRAPILLLIALAGCSLLPPDGPPETEPGPVTAPAPVSAPEPAPAPAEADPLRIAIVLSDDIPAYSDVADALMALLGERSSRRFDLGGEVSSVDAVISGVAGYAPDQVVAIGFLAARAAQRISDVPVVFCQVFNHGQADLVTPRTRGVEMIPPFDLHLRPWRDLAPGLGRIGVITGPGHERLIERAAASARNAGVELVARSVQSDQEAVYVFKRLVPEIDGFWLLPDNRVLSPRALREIMSYARKHEIQVAAFSPNLLGLGALMSVTSDPPDVAAQIASAIRAISSGAARPPGGMMSLTRASVRINAGLARDLGLDPTPVARLVSREPVR